METSFIVKQFIKSLQELNINFGVHSESCGTICLIADHNIYAEQTKNTIKIKLNDAVYEKKLFKNNTEKIKTVEQYNQLLFKYVEMHADIKLDRNQKNILPMG